jgi:hypothetical protein
MRSEFCVCIRRVFSKEYLAGIGVLLVLALFAVAPRLDAQSFSSGSDGSDGAFNPSGPPGTVVLFDPAQFHGTQVSANIFNFTTITIPVGVTVRLSGNVINGPVFWLAQGDVDIEGTIDLSGGNGHDDTTNPFVRVLSVPGSGGFAGGVGGNSVQAALVGNGPGGGTVGAVGSRTNGGGGTFSGNQFLIPLVGGSGGGGGAREDSVFAAGGGAGGGAILIASSTQIIVNGTVNANGGTGGHQTSSSFLAAGGGGSGGATRLVSNTIAGIGTLSASGGNDRFTGHPGGPGQIRLEATTVSFSGMLQGTLGQSTPFPLLLPTAGTPSAKVISIAGTPINPNPNTFPDITINTTSPVPVVIQTQNIPTTATINLTILDENNVADTVIPAPPLSNCTSTNLCTTTVQVTFPFGASRGLTKVTWTQ